MQHIRRSYSMAYYFRAGYNTSPSNEFRSVEIKWLQTNVLCVYKILPCLSLLPFQPRMLIFHPSPLIPKGISAFYEARKRALLAKTEDAEEEF